MILKGELLIRPTIQDVAKLAGYSITTVSMVMNNKDVKIPQETRDRVFQAANKLNYRPNQLAVSLITKKTNVIGLIIPDSSNQFFALLSKAIEEEAYRYDYNIIYGNTNNDWLRDQAYLHMFMDRQVDGIIYAKSASLGKAGDLELQQIISGMSVPLVLLDRPFPNVKQKAVLLNNRKGGFLATKHLLDLGHTRIGCFTGAKGLHGSMERLAGHKEALAQAGILFDERLIFEGDYQVGREAEAFRYFSTQDITAIFSFNDLMALGLIREMQKHGVRIPDEISIVGFDDIPFSDLSSPPLTTVRQPLGDLGKQAVELLLNIINGIHENETPSYLFEPKLIVRKSTKQPQGVKHT